MCIIVSGLEKQNDSAFYALLCKRRMLSMFISNIKDLPFKNY